MYKLLSFSFFVRVSIINSVLSVIPLIVLYQYIFHRRYNYRRQDSRYLLLPLTYVTFYRTCPVRETQIKLSYIPIHNDPAEMNNNFKESDARITRPPKHIIILKPFHVSWSRLRIEDSKAVIFDAQSYVCVECFPWLNRRERERSIESRAKFASRER